MTKQKKERTGPYRQPRRAVRLYFLESEHPEVRMAAAQSGLPMSEFCRQAVLEWIRLKQKRTAK